MSTAPTEPAPKPSRTSGLFGLIRRLVDYGKSLAATLREHGLGNNPVAAGYPFGTTSVALILARVARGLMRAAALEARLLRNAARLDAGPRRYVPRPAGPLAAPQPPAPRAPRHTEASRHGKANLRDAALLARLPTPEQIAAEVRRKPIGEVVADICRDLGLLPSEMWQELSRTIMRERGSLARLYQDIRRRTRRIPPETLAAALASKKLPLLALIPAGTGPP